MNTFPLKIVTADGLKYDGPAEELIVRSTAGDLGILAGHINCVAALGMGRATVIIDGKKQYAACIGGMVSIMDGAVTLVPTTFEWAQDIDLARAETALSKAQTALSDKSKSKTDLLLAEAKLRRALVRKSVAGQK